MEVFILSKPASGGIKTKQKRPPEVFLEIVQNSQENTCTRVSFLIKLQTWGSGWLEAGFSAVDPDNGRFFDVWWNTRKKKCNLIVSGVLLKHRNTNFTSVEATFICKTQSRDARRVIRALQRYLVFVTWSCLWTFELWLYLLIQNKNNFYHSDFL